MYILPHPLTGFANKLPLINRLGIRHVLSFAQGQHATLTVLLFALSTGLLAHYFGFHPAIGAYMAGLILREEYFHWLPDGAEDHYRNTRRIVENIAFSWIAPVFFVQLGAHLFIDWEVFYVVIPHTILFVVALVIAQVGSAGLAA